MPMGKQWWHISQAATIRSAYPETGPGKQFAFATVQTWSTLSLPANDVQSLNICSTVSQHNNQQEKRRNRETENWERQREAQKDDTKLPVGWHCAYDM